MGKDSLGTRAKKYPGGKTWQWWICLFILTIGFMEALVLVLQHLGSVNLPGCGVNSPCAEAAASRWGSLVGWPVSFLGLAYFAGLAGAWLSLPDFQINKGFHYLVRFGALVSIIFLAIIFLEELYCLYCLGFHAANLVFFCLVEWLPNRARSSKPLLVIIAIVFALVTSVLSVVEKQRQLRVIEENERLYLQSTAKMRTTIYEKNSRPLESNEKEPGENQPDPETPSKPDSEKEKSASNARSLFRTGPDQAPIELEVFLDYQCEHCARIDREIQAILTKFPALLSVQIKHYPLCTECNIGLKVNTHPNACRAAKVVEAAGALKGNEGYWSMHSWVFQRRGKFTDKELVQHLSKLDYDPEKFLEIVKSKDILRNIYRDIHEADERKVTGTPTIFINGIELQGWNAENALIRVIQSFADDDSIIKGKDGGKTK